MKSIFAGYYRPTEAEFKDLFSKAIFSYDASVLLDLYRSTRETRKLLINIFEKLQERTFIAFQAALEYQRNRLTVISEGMKAYEGLRAKLEQLPDTIAEEMKKNGLEPISPVKKHITAGSKKAFVALVKERSKSPNYLEKDEIREDLTRIFDKRVGSKLSDSDLATLYSQGSQRYNKKIPPGYKDSDKPEPERYGDLIIWTELKSKAKSENKPIVFVTSDNKEDWWWQHDGSTVGPRPELRTEMLTDSGQDFYIYRPERFLEEADKQLGFKTERQEVLEAISDFQRIERDRSAIQVPTSVAITFPVVSGRTGTPPNFKQLAPGPATDRLRSMPAGNWGLASLDEVVAAIEGILRRSLKLPEIEAVKRLLPRTAEACHKFVPKTTIADVVSHLAAAIYFSDLSSGAFNQSLEPSEE